MHVSGGVSNLSFAFRGNERVREAMHSVFLYHAIQAGMDMGIVNAGQLALYDDIDPELRELVEDVILNRRPDATDRLLEAAERYKGGEAQKREVDLSWREKPVEERLVHALVHGIGTYIDTDTEEARAKADASAARHRRPADGRHERGRRSVRLRQDVPAAGGEVGARDEAGGRLSHALHGEGERGAWPRARRAGGQGSLLATVKGDVHDIGKNIVGVVLQCNNYEVTDLGVMVPAQKILDTAREKKVDIIGLSGLITPSLDEMCHVAAEMEREGFDLPLLIGGATTSRVHTAVKISPNYHRSQAIYVTDASRAVGVVSGLMSPEERPKAIAKVREEYRDMAESYARGQAEKARTSLADARANRLKLDWTGYAPPKPSFLGTRAFSAYDLAELARYIDWTPFFQAWELKGAYPAHPRGRQIWRGRAQSLRRRASHAEAAHRREMADGQRRGRLLAGQQRRRRHRALRRREPHEGRSPRCTRCASRWRAIRAGPISRLPISSRRKTTGVADYVGGFAVTAGVGEEDVAHRFERANDDYSKILVKALADRLAEAFAEALHAKVRRELWAYAPGETPQQRRADRGRLCRHQARARLSGAARPHREGHPVRIARCRERDRRASSPRAMPCGPRPPSQGFTSRIRSRRYFGVGKIGRDQVADYAARKGWSVEEAERWLAPILNYDPKLIADAAE